MPTTSSGVHWVRTVWCIYPGLWRCIQSGLYGLVKLRVMYPGVLVHLGLYSLVHIPLVLGGCNMSGLCMGDGNVWCTLGSCMMVHSVSLCSVGLYSPWVRTVWCTLGSAWWCMQPSVYPSLCRCVQSSWCAMGSVSLQSGVTWALVVRIQSGVP